MFRYSISLTLLLLFPTFLQAAEVLPLVNHDLTVKIQPASGSIEVRDQIRLPEPAGSFDFLLHAGLAPKLVTQGATLQRLGAYAGVVSGQAYRVAFEQPQTRVTLDYAGIIRHPVEAGRERQSGSRAAGSPGHISEEGVFLSAASLWFPYLEERMLSFSLRVNLPDGWSSVSQGIGSTDGSRWQESAPQDDIYLIAGRYTRYEDATSPVTAEVYLRSPDPQLAQRYLQTTRDYIALYQNLIGPYPYTKFAMVENFWESGYGMPSFTLLGPRVLRFPFILHSSYPHEILHNWWGNGVYVDYQQGNWSEGLTSYLADHLIKEQRGEGAGYRRETLQRYADFVHGGDDFPLTEFRGRHGDISQAVGYGKTLMFFHMLRLQLGDPVFIQGIRRFYRDNLHRIAGFDDLRAAFEAVGKQSLGSFFEQWINSTGAPDLQVSEVEVHREGSSYAVQGTLQQKQSGKVFELTVPVAIQTEDERVSLFHLPMKQRRLSFNIPLQSNPLRLTVDPRFDLFRRLAVGETPSSLGQLFGARRMTVILPSAASTEVKMRLQRLTAAWSGYWKESTTVWDDTLDKLPEMGGVLLLGAENRFVPYFFAQLARHRVHLAQNLTLAERSFAADSHSFALTAPHPADNKSAIGLFSVGPAPATDGFARKLPHYGKYSYAVFHGDEPENIVKGQWEAATTALSINLTGREPFPPAQIPTHTPLADLPGL